MARLSLTDKKVQSITPPAAGQVEYWDALVPGLGLRVSYKGAKAWMVLKRALVAGEKKLVRSTLGQYPAMTLDAARRAARDYIEKIDRGEDPQAAKVAKAAAAVEDSRNTFSAVRGRFLTAKSKGPTALKSKTLDEYERVLTGPDFADWENRPLKSITRAQVRERLDAIDERASSIVANKAFVYLRVMLNWAVEKDVITTAPTDRMKAPDGPAGRSRVLSDDELRIVWQSLPAAGIFETPYKLLALTGQRRDEIVSLQWDEIRDLDGDKPYILLPAARTKNRLPHIVPLAPAAAFLLRMAKENRTSPPECPYVFTTTGKTPLSGFSSIKRTIDGAISTRIAEELEVAKKACDDRQLESLKRAMATPWRLHDLRRTVVTGLNSMGIKPHIVEALVNHVSGAAKAGVAGVYNHAEYLPERRAALEMWARHIERIDARPTGGRVIEFVARA